MLTQMGCESSETPGTGFRGAFLREGKKRFMETIGRGWVACITGVLGVGISFTE